MICGLPLGFAGALGAGEAGNDGYVVVETEVMEDDPKAFERTLGASITSQISQVRVISVTHPGVGVQ